ncbi:hypothetical protein KUTeg_007391 [Tegillarca granosa]|uniref:Uncharacterized protein n=1 Tax=Tegillarca granosa TaxID=220873 RepID=A0ABQ9FF41_TEGGR|nr:hypothetical protein KUTeg_007391 [Tegillarca granosa]
MCTNFTHRHGYSVYLMSPGYPRNRLPVTNCECQISGRGINGTILDHVKDGNSPVIMLIITQSFTYHINSVKVLNTAIFYDASKVIVIIHNRHSEQTFKLWMGFKGNGMTVICGSGDLIKPTTVSPTVLQTTDITSSVLFPSTADYTVSTVQSLLRVKKQKQNKYEVLYLIIGVSCLLFILLVVIIIMAVLIVREERAKHRYDQYSLEGNDNVIFAYGSFHNTSGSNEEDELDISNTKDGYKNGVLLSFDNINVAAQRNNFLCNYNFWKDSMLLCNMGKNNSLLLQDAVLLRFDISNRCVIHISGWAKMKPSPADIVIFLK